MIAVIQRGGATAELAFENGRWADGNEIDGLQDKLGIDGVTRGLVNIVTREVASQFVFVIVVIAETELFAIGRHFQFLIQHHQLRGAPGLSRPPDVAPEFVVRLVSSACR